MKEKRPIAKGLVSRLYLRAVDRLSFSGKLYKQRRELNERIDRPDPPPAEARSHPLGVARYFKRRRISIAEAYLAVVRDLDSSHAASRLRALRSMMDASLHTQALELPLNAARVQMALMKEAVKARDDRRRQLELLADFSASSRGRSRTIRRLLSELDLVELPEGLRLEGADAGFDGHVHDAGSSGRKNPTQLLIDAFIKGISRLRVVYGGSSSIAAMEEALEAGAILGVRVDLGIELGVEFEGRRFHFVALLPPARRASGLRRFFAANRRALKKLLEGLEEDQEKRLKAIGREMEAFNEGPLKSLNAPYPDRREFRIPPLRMKDLVRMAGHDRARIDHLGELLWRRWKPIALNRILYLKVARDGRYASAREEYRTMHPEALRARYFPRAPQASTFSDLASTRRILERAGCRLRLARCLEHGPDALRELLERDGDMIDEIEAYDAADARPGGEGAAALARIVRAHNASRVRGGLAPIAASLGSDSTERSPELPGMGFLREFFLKGKDLSRYAARHEAVPEEAARLAFPGGGRVFRMGRPPGMRENLVGDGEDLPKPPPPLGRALRYLNPSLSGTCLSLIGFAVAALVLGPLFALLWLAITGSRNALVDLLALRGGALRRWSAKGVDWGNVAQSLFWTGFSVPIMAFIKAGFDAYWPLAFPAASPGSAVFETAKFFFISLANGLYIASHNVLRGFDKPVARANLFRTILSWPLAAVASPLGNALGIPSIVQSKIWSDAVAGLIEGSRKYATALRLRRRDLEEIVPRMLKGRKTRRTVAAFDLLYLFREEPRLRTSLASVLAADRSKARELEAALADPGLDGRLLGYALSRGRGQAVELAGLIAETLPELRAWLAARSGGPEGRPRRGRRAPA